MSLPHDTTEISMSHKKPFWHNLASPLRERPPSTPHPPSSSSNSSSSRFRALATNHYLLNRSKQRTSESQTKPTSSDKQQPRGFRRRGEVIDQTPLGISATNYSVPDDYKGAPSRLLVEQEVIFFDNQDQQDEDCSSLFDGAWETNSSIDDSEISSSSSNDSSVEIPPPPSPTARVSRVHSIEQSSNKKSKDTKSSDSSRSSIDSSSSSSKNPKAASVKIIATMDSVLTPPPVEKRSGLTIFSRNRSDAKRKAKEIVEQAREKENGICTQGAFTTVTENHNAVSIFLLLLENESKMFELIQVRFVFDYRLFFTSHAYTDHLFLLYSCDIHEQTQLSTIC